MSRYLQRLAISAVKPGGAIHPVLDSAFSAPKRRIGTDSPYTEESVFVAEEQADRTPEHSRQPAVSAGQGRAGADLGDVPQSVPMAGISFRRDAPSQARVAASGMTKPAQEISKSVLCQEPAVHPEVSVSGTEQSESLGGGDAQSSRGADLQAGFAGIQTEEGRLPPRQQRFPPPLVEAKVSGPHLTEIPRRFPDDSPTSERETLERERAGTSRSERSKTPLPAARASASELSSILPAGAPGLVALGREPIGTRSERPATTPLAPAMSSAPDSAAVLPNSPPTALPRRPHVAGSSRKKRRRRIL